MKSTALTLLLIISLPVASSVSAKNKYDTPHAKKLFQTLVECKNTANYDAHDCFRAVDLELELERQQQLPDNQRPQFGSLGRSVLVERATGLRAGVFPTTSSGKKWRELRITDNGTTYGFTLGAAEGCKNTTYYVVRNAPKFLFLIDTCIVQTRSGLNQSYRDQLVYDKTRKVVFSINRTINTGAQPEPELTWSNGIYRYRWNYINEQKEKTREYFDFRLKNSEAGECMRAWNDDCPIFPASYAKRNVPATELK